MAAPERFVEPDPELPLALLDQKEVSLNTISILGFFLVFVGIVISCNILL